MRKSKFYIHKHLSPSRAVEGISDLLLLEGRQLYQIDFTNLVDRNFRNWYISKDLESARTVRASDVKKMLEDYLTQKDITLSSKVHTYHRLDAAGFIAGRYYPRIFRPIFVLDKTSFFTSATLRVEKLESELKGVRDYIPVEHELMLMAVSQLSLLVENLKAICRTIHPSADNLAVHGNEIRNLLILACTEVEAQLVGIYIANSPKQNDKRTTKDRYTTNDYVKLAPFLKLNAYRIFFNLYPFLDGFQPFRGWSATKPTESIPWYKDYHAVKHNREIEFKKANLENLFNAIAALAILLVAQYGEATSVWSELIGQFFYFDKKPVWSSEEMYLPPWKDHGWEKGNVFVD